MIKRSPQTPSPPSSRDAADAVPESGLGSASAASTGSEIGAAIGAQLRAMFDAVASEPVPARLQALLDELARKAGKS